MKKIYQENYFSRRNWIMENIRELGLSAEEVLILLMIDYKNEFRMPVSIESLSEATALKETDTDRIVTELCQKGYLKVSSSARKIVFDISGLFEERKPEPSKDIFDVFESEFRRPLSQKETTMLGKWKGSYAEVTILKALREAIKYNKLSFDYIDRILVNGELNASK